MQPNVYRVHGPNGSVNINYHDAVALKTIGVLVEDEADTSDERVVVFNFRSATS